MANMLPRLALTFALLTAACGELRSPEEVAGPDTYALPAPDPSLDPGRMGRSAQRASRPTLCARNSRRTGDARPARAGEAPIQLAFRGRRAA